MKTIIKNRPQSGDRPSRSIAVDLDTEKGCYEALRATVERILASPTIGPYGKLEAITAAIATLREDLENVEL